MSSRNCKFSRRHFLNIFDIYYNPSTYITQVICKRTVGGTIISIRNNRLALFLKLFQIIDDFASEKCCSIFQCRLVNNYSFPTLSPHLRFRKHRTNTSLPVPEMPSNILRLLLLRYLLLYPDL